MKLRFQQSGGFAGLVRGCEIKTADLPPAISSLVAELQKSGLPKSAAPSALRDGMMCELWLEEPKQTVKFTLQDGEVPEKLEPLLEFLRSRSKPQAPV